MERRKRQPPPDATTIDGDESTLSYQQLITHHPAADPVAR
jgi:hypothetical protein